MIRCSAVQLRQSRSGSKWADFAYFNAVDDPFAKSQLPECDSSTPRSFGAWYQALLWEMRHERTDDEVRRNRINPRVIKRKMSKFKKKRPEHRKAQRLKKTFAETVVMTR
jgi:hypothetical protein